MNYKMPDSVIENMARLAVMLGAPVDEICDRMKRSWSAHERLEMMLEQKKRAEIFARIKENIDAIKQRFHAAKRPKTALVSWPIIFDLTMVRPLVRGSHTYLNPARERR